MTAIDISERAYYDPYGRRRNNKSRIIAGVVVGSYSSCPHTYSGAHYISGVVGLFVIFALAMLFKRRRQRAFALHQQAAAAQTHQTYQQPQQPNMATANSGYGGSYNNSNTTGGYGSQYPPPTHNGGQEETKPYEAPAPPPYIPAGEFSPVCTILLLTLSRY